MTRAFAFRAHRNAVVVEPIGRVGTVGRCMWLLLVIELMMRAPGMARRPSRRRPIVGGYRCRFGGEQDRDSMRFALNAIKKATGAAALCGLRETNVIGI